MVEFQEDKQNQKISELHRKEAEELAQILAKKHGLPYLDLSNLPINTDALRLISESEARLAQVAAFKISGKQVYVLTVAPESLATKKLLEELQGKNYKLEVYLGSPTSLERAWSRYGEISVSTKTEAGVIDISNEDIKRFVTELKDLPSIKALLDQEGSLALKEGGISSLLEIVLAGGLVTKASDIHFEPEEQGVRLRYRLDGVLNDLVNLPEKLYRQVLSRVKLVSGLKLNVKQNAQDGRFSLRLDQGDIEIRTSVLPGAYGESIVLRLLNPETLTVGLNNLGMEPNLFACVEQEIKKPNGLILLTGPTGSGKTTTLYAFLKEINTPDSKIITIEDPIEYHLKGVNQTQVNPEKDYTFLSGLRSALRQDPDIIMVGEIRDSETAEIAVNASLTGHLVFSTLHTNNAAGTIPRLVDLGVNPKVLDSALNIALAQRLVRKLCPDCRKPASPNAEEKSLIEKVLLAIKQKRPEFIAPNPTIFSSNNCAACHGTGYRGRIGIFEAIIVNQKIADLLLSGNPNERELRLAALDQKLLDMREDGVIKVLSGITSFAELARVIDLNEEILMATWNTKKSNLLISKQSFR